MKKSVLQFCAGLLAVILLSVMVVPCYAVTDEYTSTGTFWSSLKEKWWLGLGPKFLIGQLADSACSESPDSRHHGSLKTYAQNSDGSYTAICNYCSADFPVYDADLSAAYDDYVTTLPAQGYTSTGGFLWQPTWADVLGLFPGNLKAPNYLESYTFDPSGTTLSFAYRPVFFPGSFSVYINPFPYYGAYRVYVPFQVNYRYQGNRGTITSKQLLSPVSSDTKRLTPSSTYQISISTTNQYQDWASETYTSFNFVLPIFEVIPDTVIDKDITYDMTTRPTSISGGNYGIVGDNGQITKVEGNSTIVNETNNTYYNPATGQTVPITNWSYDYSDRSYKLELDGGKTSTVIYGDENITITETTINESGDTITNNYTIYYLIDGSGSETPPSACEHDWQEGDAVVPTCVRPGSASYVCSKCRQTKTEAIPALGHSWQVKQTVTTEYDDMGQLVQQGYTIFECSTCHEQYKSTDGTAPPGGGSGTDPGGEEDEGFLSWLLGKIGEFLGTVGDGILNLLKTALDKIFGGLIDLVTSLFENLSKLVDLFGSVGDAFGVLWTWLPPEIMAILVVGVSIFVFVALLKFFMK